MPYDPWKDVSDEDLFARRSEAEFKLDLCQISQAPILAFILKWGTTPGMEALIAAFERAVDTYDYYIKKYTSIITAITVELAERGLV